MTTAISTTRTPAVATRTLLAAGIVAAPLWAAVSLTQAFTREGFDLTRHPLSMLSTGSLGWLQIANFIVAGMLAVAGSRGLRRVLRGTPGGTWAPRLTLVNGIGMIAAGVFVMDPADGFPAGTPAGAPAAMSWHSVLHLVSGSLSFIALAAACFVLGRHFARTGARRHAVASRIAGAAVIVGNAWAMSGGTAGSMVLAVGVIAGTLWIAATCAHLRGKA